MLKRFIVYIFFPILLILIANCASRATHYQSGSIEEAKLFLSMPQSYPAAPQDVEEKKEEKEYEEIDRYKAILEQEFQFNPPVSILLMIPSTPKSSWWHYYGYSTYIDSLNSILFRSLSEEFESIEFVSNLELASSFFSSASTKSLREIAAYYRADEVLLVSYDLQIVQPSSCLGFWPGTHLEGLLSSETMLIDTRTGFFLVGRKYSFSKSSSSISNSFKLNELEIMRLIVDEWTHAIVADLLEFYEGEVK